MSNEFFKAAARYFGVAEGAAHKTEVYTEGGVLVLALEIPLSDADLAGIADRMKTMQEQAPGPAYDYVEVEVPSEQRMRDEYNAMDKRSRSEFGAFHRYKAWRLGTTLDTVTTGKVELPAHIYLSPAEATAQQKAMAIGRDERGNYAIAVEDLTEEQFKDALRNQKITADRLRADYVQRTMDAHARLNGADEQCGRLRRGAGMITIDEVREILRKAKGQAEHVFSDEGNMVQQAIDYLFVVADTELLKKQKAEVPG